MDILLAGKSALITVHGRHMHETWEIISNIEGQGVFEFDGEMIPFDEKTIVCIPPRVPHAKFSDEGFRDIWVQLAHFPSLDTTKPTFLTDDSDCNISSLINILYSVRYGKIPNYTEISDTLVDSIQQLILSRLEHKKIDPRVEQIMNRIIHHFQDPDFSLEECLAFRGYCPDHMRRVFREQIGKTPQEYLNDLRIKTAKKLLSSRHISNYSVTEICTMVGFGDISYFSRVFKKTTGFSPSEYTEKR